jgi:hypothetical protein
MKPTSNRAAAVFVLALLATTVPSAHAHKHLDTGALEQGVGSKLFFKNGAGYEASSGFLYRLTPTNHLTLGPIFRSGDTSKKDPDVDNNPVLTTLPIEPDNGGPDPFAAQPGARIALRVASVAGPEGGAFSMWDSDGDYIAEDITFTVPVGTTNGTSRFYLSENNGSPGSDPYGHIHGRRFSVDRPGLYTVGFQIVDISTNGPGGGPLHAPSDVFQMLFQAGTSIVELVPDPEGDSLTFGTESGRTYQIESARELGPGAEWSPVGGLLTGNGRLQTVEGLPSSTGPVFYRLRITQP